MVDRFKSMTELFDEMEQGVDWEVQVRKSDQPILITAVHGGAIERGTTELGRCVSDKGDYNFYTFKGIRKNKNNELHVTSEHFDDPTLNEMVEQNDIAVSLHGCKGDQPEVYIGGNDDSLIEKIEQTLSEIEVVVKPAPRHIDGKGKANFVNRCQKGAGVQLELTEQLRKDFFKNKKFSLHHRENEDNWDDFMFDFAEALIKAIEQER
ncbi:MULTISPECIES: poly-gamma-glutamate hydrolase family protein [Staphylococcus]|uniref:Poly-gamma-glutamate hydrolase family protein n=1 Tax=Staphylococcus hsinchuensis TaxID=3051183 RepID=A0ABZ3EB89_9STAP|nr:MULTISPECIES: poly-gamma-glutamate hydrolase family protein [unclassified Staphylococcus]